MSKCGGKVPWKGVAHRKYVYEVGDRAKGFRNFLNIVFGFDYTAYNTTLEQTYDCFALVLNRP